MNTSKINNSCKFQKVTGYIFTLLAVMCVAYFIFLRCIQANGFDKFWIAAAFIFAGLGFVLIYSKGGFSRLPKWLLILVEGVVAIGCILFIIVEAFIVIWSGKPCSDADCMVILGAKVTGGRPSLSLKARLDAAAVYLKNNPACSVIVSGGKGADEEISEAQCMYEYLLSSGIEPQRIILEEESTSTVENLNFSAKLCDVKNTRVVIVTNDFHIFRSLQLAQKLGYTDVCGLAAKSPWYLIPTNYTREFLAVCKDFIFGNF